MAPTAIGTRRETPQCRFPEAEITIANGNAFDILSAAVAALHEAGANQCDIIAFTDSVMDGSDSFDEFLAAVGRWVSIRCDA